MLVNLTQIVLLAVNALNHLGQYMVCVQVVYPLAIQTIDNPFIRQLIRTGLMEILVSSILIVVQVAGV